MLEDLIYYNLHFSAYHAVHIFRVTCSTLRGTANQFMPVLSIMEGIAYCGPACVYVCACRIVFHIDMLSGIVGSEERNGILH